MLILSSETSQGNKIEEFDSMIELDDETRQDIIQKYVLLLKSRRTYRTSVRPILYAIELFFNINKKIVHKTIFNKMVQGRLNIDNCY